MDSVGVGYNPYPFVNVEPLEECFSLFFVSC